MYALNHASWHKIPIWHISQSCIYHRFYNHLVPSLPMRFFIESLHMSAGLLYKCIIQCLRYDFTNPYIEWGKLHTYTSEHRVCLWHHDVLGTSLLEPTAVNKTNQRYKVLYTHYSWKVLYMYNISIIITICSLLLSHRYKICALPNNMAYSASQYFWSILFGYTVIIMCHILRL